MAAFDENHFRTPLLGLGLAVVGLGAYHVLCFHTASFPFAWCGPLASPLRSLAANHLTAAQCVYALIWVAHAYEGWTAHRLARKAGLKSAPKWAFQTFIVGFPSLLLLKSYARKHCKSK